MTQTPPTAPIAWHCLLGEVLEKLLTPVGLSVHPELSLMSRPPRADVLILRRQQARWTTAQLERLPDGVRDSQASHILLMVIEKYILSSVQTSVSSSTKD